MTIPSEAMELLYTAGGDVKSYKDFGIQFSGLEKKKHIPTIWFQLFRS